MSRRMAVDQRRHAAGMVDIQGLQQGLKFKLLLGPNENL